jgi:hypothetical protein
MAKIIDDPNSPLHGMTLSSLPADVYLEAARSEDDIGVLLRSHYLIESACRNLCEVLYPNYGALGHENLSQYLRAIRAIGFSAPVLRMADVVNKHRGPSAHVKARVITAIHVDELNAQSSGVLKIPGTLLSIGSVQTSDGRLVPITQPTLRIHYVMLSINFAGAIDYLAQRRKPAAA